MDDQPYMPALEVYRLLLGNLRRARLEIEAVGLQLEEVIARLDQDIPKQRLSRVQQSLARPQ